MKTQPESRDNEEPTDRQSARPAAAFGGGALIGTLGGLIGLGGDEFRLPLLIGGLLLGLVPGAVLLPLLAAILLVSAAKVWRHRPGR